MTRVSIDIDDPTADELRKRAEERGMSMDEYVRDILQRELKESWPADFFSRIAGGWKGEPLERPPQGKLEDREEW